MKTYVTYGFFMALGGLLLTLVFYFAGFHSDPAKIASSQWMSACGLLILGITITSLGVKARRAEVPVTEPFGYGRALGAGVMITLFAALFGVVTGYLYFHVINPGFIDLLVQTQLDKIEASGASGARLEQAEKMTRMFMSPVALTIVNFLSGMFWGTLISLVVAAFLKRKPADETVVSV
ncbi:MAG: hypothetical protein JWM32_2232 [Verrucomicrobia bacterium]|nr:hypothetical protein [Verrucomicrobiota bacterium]